MICDWGELRVVQTRGPNAKIPRAYSARGIQGVLFVRLRCLEAEALLSYETYRETTPTILSRWMGP